MRTIWNPPGMPSVNPAWRDASNSASACALLGYMYLLSHKSSGFSGRGNSGLSAGYASDVVTNRSPPWIATVSPPKPIARLM